MNKNKLKLQIKRYNDKVKRIVKKYPVLKELYSDTLKYSELSKVIKTSKDLSKLTNTINKLFNDNNIKPIEIAPDVFVNKWAVNEYSKDIKLINKEKQKQLDILLKTPFKGTEFSYVQMGGALDSELKPITKLPEDFKSAKDFSKALKIRCAQSFEGYREFKNKLYKENFIKSIKHLGNEYYDEDGTVRKINLVKWIEKIPSNKFTSFIQSIGENLHLLLNENYTADQLKERMTELVDIINDNSADYNLPALTDE